ncbi:hypothetical protein BDW02DRAFT_569198 [Decorospora gaudefroyi]|uniref:Uncharacterized protein n=1 Tax=Decorospora gaudefroyi TaxID=184978 RepID=A0A6A5KFH2_9PLEO|nr:hypothetical protein BDW02DRAFT_569198 [Decorospora gaudefroyi]
MKSSMIALTLIGAVVAHPATIMKKREVPQEHAHENILRAVNILLQQNNPDNIQDAVFGLLGAAAAIEGAGNIADADCLQQATADQAFTNAKEAGDVDGMTNALIFRALERNTGSVGLVSVPCESIQAVNPEIAALQQHQDPASDGAQELNKQIAEELARQIASIGGDPTLANEASTFAPGEIGDPTGAGNTCDDAEDAEGCINSLNLRVDDLSDAEIAAAVNADNTAAIGADASAFGDCNPTISFGIPSDGRNEDAFEPADLSAFNHGSALNIAVISNFICSQISSKCGVSTSVVTSCDAAASLASQLQGQAAADAFNSAFGL